ncbi:hypothetical protein CHS0354_031217 [Potamilus streckersoni]|uniref:Uncharacterized protein n=1 Tax=Potamilus streckersoni TaxID=2493646 RepID=A0AAE0TKG8_9BIVA|nr:hypothetical protein CHS0354_031217 [Potamilus streckersoni]
MTLQFRTIGGILDFYVYTGPSPDDVIRQHSEVIGRTFMPPYWALGYNLCRWGYNNDRNLKAVINRMRQLQIPYETQWSDIDYMKDKLDFTYDKQNFADLPNIVDDLHSHGQRYVVILILRRLEMMAFEDPGISSEQPPGTYPPYDDGVREDIFIKTHDSSQILIGKVWPGLTAFPDFTHPKIIDYWTRQVRSLYNQLPFDGLWIDMNEPANFVEGSNTGCTDNSLDKPPYTPWIADGNLATKTLCPSARQNLSSHYNLHSMYGYFEAKATFEALKSVRQRRSLVISRSTFPGSGVYGGHWEGDNNAVWSDMYYSIPALLNANMYGIPLMGSDICGFGGYPTEELCVRWTQLASFYTFMRNHRDFNAFDQDPASPAFRESQHILKSAVEFRYRLLPYLYTLFFESHTKGTPVGARTVNAYFPTDKWYDAYTGKEVANTGQNVTLAAPLETINVHVRGGTVIPMQEHNLTTAASVGKDYKLVIAPSEAGIAAGDLFVDDGEALDAISGMKYILLHFTATKNELRSTVQVNGLQKKMTLGEITVFGISENPRQVLVNGKHSAHSYDTTNKVLNIQRFQIDMLSPIHATWS